MKIVWHKDGFYDLRRDAGITRDLEARARRVADAAGEGFEVSSYQGQKAPQGRWQTNVVTATPKAMARNAKHNTLLRSLDAGRG